MLINIVTALLPADVPLWAGAFALLALLYTAVVDARTGLVPPLPLAVAGLLLMAGLIIDNSSRDYAAPLHAILFYCGVFAVNEAHYRLTGRDALGLGDAHWSLVAVLAYGMPVTLMAWGVGAWLAIIWLGLRRLIGEPSGQVYFVPFLFVALILLRLRALL